MRTTESRASCYLESRLALSVLSNERCGPLTTCVLEVEGTEDESLWNLASIPVPTRLDSVSVTVTRRSLAAVEWDVYRALR